MHVPRFTLGVVLAASLCLAAVAVAQDDAVQLLDRAGNADTDAERIALLKQLRDVPGLAPALRDDADKLISEIDTFMNNPRTDYFSRSILDNSHYDFGIAGDSPLHPITQIYDARMRFWVGVEYGGYWSVPEKRRELFDSIREQFEEVSSRFPENDILRMYLGEPIPAPQQYDAPEGAPEWAVHQREGLERLADIVAWWIDNRMRENGEFGGGWGDDCEMWRWWAPVLIAFDDPKISAAQARFSEALLSQPHMAGGYTVHMSDVEHTGEDSSDALTPMMHIEPDNERWSAMAMGLAELGRTLWMGENERGQWQFKSTYFNVNKVETDPRKACDSVYHGKAFQPTLLYWQRTGDPGLTRLFSRWMDTWVDATARAERGKPAGVVPSAVHWPDGSIGGLGENWWDPENHTSDPLYVWPSAMHMMLNTLLLTHHMTGQDRYLDPIRSMARVRLDYLENPVSDPEPGTSAWCGMRMPGALRDVAAKHRLLTGKHDFDALLDREVSPYMALRLNGERQKLAKALATAAAAFRINWPGYTSEVRYTDRVLRFPHVFGANCMYPEARPGIPTPDTQVLYSAATGDPGDGGFFPLNAVRWLTPPRNIAALVTEAGPASFQAELYVFDEQARVFEAELYLLAPGRYTASLLAADGATIGDSWEVAVNGKRTRVRLALPPRQAVTLRILAAV